MADRRRADETPLAPRRSLSGPSTSEETETAEKTDKLPLSERVSAAVSAAGSAASSKSSKSSKFVVEVDPVERGR